MSQEFIKQPNLPVTKSMPSLMGINLNGIQKPTGYGDIIAKALQYTNALVDKADTIKQNNEVTNLKQKLDDMENEFAFTYLADPNAYNTEEGRNKIIHAYNDLIEQKKIVLQDSNVELSKDNRDKLNGYFKDTTWNKLMNMQQGLNQGFLKEQTDNVLLSSEKSVMLLPTYTDPIQQEMEVSEQLKNIKSLERFGIRTDKMQLQYLTSSQEAITDKKINVDIINNNTDERFFKKELVNGEWVTVYDNNGNPIIDTTKKLTALHELADTFLSDEECMDSAKSIHQQTGIDLETAYAYIRNARKEKWIKTYYTSSAKLAQQQAIEAEKTRQWEQNITDNIQKNVTDTKLAINDKDIYTIATKMDVNNVGLTVPEILTATNTVTGRTNSEELYGDTPQGLYNRGFYVDVLNDKQLKALTNTIELGTDGSLNEGTFFSNMNFLRQNMYTKDGANMLPQPFIESIAEQYARNTPIALLKYPSFVKAGAGLNEGDNTQLQQNDIAELLNATSKIKALKKGDGTYRYGTILDEDEPSELNHILGAYAITYKRKWGLNITENSSIAMIDNAIKNNRQALNDFKILKTKVKNGLTAPRLNSALLNEDNIVPTVTQTSKEQSINKFSYQIKDPNIRHELDKETTGKAVLPQFQDNQKGVYLTVPQMDNEAFLKNLNNNWTMMKDYEDLDGEINRRDFTDKQLYDCLYNIPINHPLRGKLNSKLKQLRGQE